VRFARIGATVEAVDLSVCRPSLSAGPFTARLNTHSADLRDLQGLGLPAPDVIYSQRTFHYLRYEEALRVLMSARHAARHDAMLFLSVSGIHSELAHGTRQESTPLGRRFARLRVDMREKHQIRERVCLYTEADLERLLLQSGWHVRALYTSNFGNVKAVANRQGLRARKVFHKAP
jgi:hypothetical protein